MSEAIPSLRTPRLLLRPWREDDLAPFAALNADPEVMEFFPQPLSREASDASAQRNRDHFALNGFGFWAVEIPEQAPFIGIVGLIRVPFPAPFTPAVEIGWRLARAHWGKGYATEAARKALKDGFTRLRLAEVVSFTATINTRSQRLMERLGMVRDPRDDFDHPRVTPGHPLQRHVLYRLKRGAFPSEAP